MSGEESELSIGIEGDQFLSPDYQRASDIIDRLPVQKDKAKGSFFDYPDTSTPQKQNAWQTASVSIEAIAAEGKLKSPTGLQIWAADAAIGAGDFERAIAIFPPPALLARRSASTSKILSLKQALGHPIAARDIVTLFGATLTKFGRENVESIVQFLEIRVNALIEKEGRDYINEWARDAHEALGGSFLFNGHVSYLRCNPPKGYSYNLSPTAERECKALIRDAENTWREEQGIPRIGEGWVSETALYYQIKDAFPDVEVSQHASPKWLGRQHLDVFIPDYRVALEYHGLQHDQPVAFFGGQAAFEQTVRRDRAKRRKCTRNCVTIVYVREGYDLARVIDDVRQASGKEFT